MRRQLSARQYFPAALPGARKDAERSFPRADGRRVFRKGRRRRSLRLIRRFRGKGRAKGRFRLIPGKREITGNNESFRPVRTRPERLKGMSGSPVHQQPQPVA
jgi:hypothetical protein